MYFKKFVFVTYLKITSIACNLLISYVTKGLTDTTIPRRLGPKRVGKIRKLYNLSKEDDVRQYVIRRPLPPKEGKKQQYKVIMEGKVYCMPEAGNFLSFGELSLAKIASL